ncbi:hypothetical protein COCCADRAFT_2296 [Bipolaris zeicola 26-R-13]|uniref:Uncharacterized protein n=1 Tax=Cochliobolus carbonum (strain 26-R-13) TaxID=930089 RepID=W6YG60_COCC2|nr:uncharacterized protein COCCADRAFT_2296 [Bipolaris zeicola 26-R-13]EUC36638.1 hypothetical protein COCCADRAFT_2296 [Bipolaris zeicola 26-R-13]
MSDYTVAMADSYSMIIDWLLALISISVCSILLFLMFLVVICFWVVIALINFISTVLFMTFLITISILMNIRGSEESQEYGRIQDLYVDNMPSLGNHWCTREAGPDDVNSNPYHYSNRDGSYYYSNADGSKYFNDCKGGAWFTPPPPK